MCGIAGIIASDRGADVGPVLERLTSGLRHRGPDGTGYHFVGPRFAALGHRRLSIVDVACGAQPMSNEDGSVWVTYNGEIYNHLEIRAQLESLGHRFRTAADTEVVVHGWEEWGPGIFERLNGIYALALYDGKDGGRIVLARDPVGVKPLYLGVGSAGWWFSSELAAVREAGLLDPAVRPDAIAEFLVYRFIPSPGTFFQHAWKVPPGHWCAISLLSPGREPHFTPFETDFVPAVLPRSREEWEEAIRAELTAAVRRQLMSEVPVGSLLSGGVDSTVVTKIMNESLAEPPHSFAVGLLGGGPNELEPARRAATALGVSLTEVEVTEQEFLAAWPEQVAGLGEPVANSGVLLLGLLCRTVGKTHKVVLSGQGADEPLGGYPRHAGERWFPLLRRVAPALDVIPRRWAGSDRVERVRRLARQSDEARRFTEILAVFSPGDVGRMVGHAVDADALAAPVRRWLPPDDGADTLNSLLRVDARLSLADDLLLVADHMAMASSVELRVPFLDLRLLGLLEAMPSHYKVSRLGERKWLYRKAVKQLLPPGLQPSLTGMESRVGRKLGFTTPIDRWLAEWVETSGETYLSGSGARLPEYLDRGAVRGVVAEGRAGGPRTRQLLSLYVLETWLRGATR